MAVQLLAPRMGEGVEELTVIRWLKKAGEAVREMEPLVEVETDKVVTEIPSPASGVVQDILVEEQSIVRVGQVMAVIGVERVEGEVTPVAALDAKPGLQAAYSVARESPGVMEKTGGRVWISPVVRRMAVEHGIDIGLIRGTGMGGRVTKQDVLDYLAAQQETGREGQAALREGEGGGGLVQVSSMRRQIAERMVQSVHRAPHVLTVMEADMSRVLAHQAKHKERFAADGVRLTLTAYLVEALAHALHEHPLVNSTWEDDGIRIYGEVNIGMAVAIGKEGLIVPVIRHADGLSLLGVARAVNDLAERARTKKLLPEDVRGGTFSLTNHGTGGSLFAMPIINQPQTGILGTGTLQKRAVVVTDAEGNDMIAIRPMMYLSLVFDHRVLDGASADAFLAAVKQRLERGAAG